MKKLMLLIISVLSVLEISAQNVTFSSKTPEAGQPVSFTYNPAGGALDKLANVKCVVTTFINLKQKEIEVPLTKEGTLYKGSFNTVDSNSIAILNFNADGTKDKNPTGYYTLFYKNGNPTGAAYYMEAQFHMGMGAMFSGAEVNKPKALVAFEKAFAVDPSLKAKYGNQYFRLQYGEDKVKGAKLILAQIASLKASNKGDEDSAMKMSELYTIMNKKSSADSVNAIIKAKFPTGVWAYGDAYNKLYSEKDLVKKEAELNAIIKKFKLDATKKADAEKLNRLYQMIASAYGSAKNNVKFEEYANKITNKEALAGIYNSVAWPNAEKKENLEFSAKISKKSLDLIEAAKKDPVPEFYSSKEDYIKNLESGYGMYADTYALLAHHLGKNEEALKYQEYAVNINKYADAEMNGRYVTFLAKAGQPEKVVTYAERFIKEGMGSEQMKAELKAAYKGNQPFDAYYAVLEKEAIEKEKAKFIKEMMNIPAPKFSLTNLKGQKVSLEELKGKVVIVDYWATWCGPCIASFPGMQKAVDKYKNDPNVVFLFVNTWQNEENREKVVKDWMAANTKYTFNVLLDTKNAKDPSKFDVISQYDVEGIPTKFIIDGGGNIRFRKEGFNGSADGTVRELDMMIALAKGSKETSK